MYIYLKNHYKRRKGSASLELVFSIIFLTILIYVFSIHIEIYTLIRNNDQSIENNIYEIVDKEKQYINSKNNPNEITLEDEKVITVSNKYDQNIFKKNNTYKIFIKREVLDSTYCLIKSDITISLKNKSRDITIFTIME